jgi:hypothetical protein
MLAGKAVLATAGGGSDELVADGETGFLFDADRVDELCGLLERYVREPGLLRSHGDAGAVRARSFSADDIGTAAAIARLREAAQRPPYRLPQIARVWFERLADPRGRVIDGLAVVVNRGAARLLRRK